MENTNYEKLDAEFEKDFWYDRLTEYCYTSRMNTDIDVFKQSSLWKDMEKTAKEILGAESAKIWPCSLVETSDGEAITLTFAIAGPSIAFSKSLESLF